MINSLKLRDMTMIHDNDGIYYGWPDIFLTNNILSNSSTRDVEDCVKGKRKGWKADSCLQHGFSELQYFPRNDTYRFFVA